MTVKASVRESLASDGRYRCTPMTWDQLIDAANSVPASDAVVGVAVPLPVHAAEAFHWLHQRYGRTPTVLVLPDNVADGVLEMAAGAVDDFVFSPLRLSELRYRLDRLLPASDTAAAREILLQEMGRAQLVGNDPIFLQALDQLPRFARSGLPMLITGETGTGKELCARAIHFLSARRDHPFIAVDCGALPEHLVENELFGHARGAYTDAHRDQRGLISMAERGTLFLDEIDSLSLSAQAKVLRFLQDRSYRPLGSDHFRHADVNVIAATNRDLEVAVRNKIFRADLFYRLNVLHLHLPALRLRRRDIPVLAAHFLGEHGRNNGAGPRIISAAAMEVLSRHSWPGNVRELANVVQRAIVACDSVQILPCHIGLLDDGDAVGHAGSQFRIARTAAVATFERRFVEDLLQKHNGNVTRAAREAQKDRRVFGRLIKKHGINR